MNVGRVLLLALMLVSMQASADIRFREFHEEEEEKAPWQEREVTFPAFPKDEDLIEVFVSATTSNRFFVDPNSISTGEEDRVVRYALVIRTAGGAKNVTFEGIRCGKDEYRIYATGRSDGTWAKARISEWRPIVNKPINRHHSALSHEFFCPLGDPIRTPQEGRNALKLGNHPSAR